MSYQCGIGPGLEHLGALPCEPHIICDGCSLFEPGTTRDGMAKAWLRNGKAPKGWLLIRTEEPFTRRDYCPRCKGEASLLAERKKRLGCTDAEVADMGEFIENQVSE